MQAFAEIQNNLTTQSQTVADQAVSNEAWQQLLSMQAPLMQGMMGNYIEQSKNMFLKMQDQMNEQTSSMFNGFVKPTNDK